MLLKLITYAKQPIEIDIHHDDTLKSIKRLVYDESGILPKHQRLIWRRRVMYNTRMSAKDYGMVSGSEVRLILLNTPC